MRNICFFVWLGGIVQWKQWLYGFTLLFRNSWRSEDIEINEPDSIEDYSGQFKLRIPKTLHRTLALNAKREGISMNQYCVYLLSRNDALLSK